MERSRTSIRSTSCRLAGHSHADHESSREALQPGVVAGRPADCFQRRVEGDRVAIMLVPPFGGPERKLAEVSAIPVGLSWTPDASGWPLRRRTHRGASQHLVVSVDTGERRRLTVPRVAPGAFGDATPSLFPGWAHAGLRREEKAYVVRPYALSLFARPEARGRTAQAHRPVLCHWDWNCVDPRQPGNRVWCGRPRGGPAVAAGRLRAERSLRLPFATEMFSIPS